MTLCRTLAVLAAAIAAVPAAAAADPPWSAPAAVDGVSLPTTLLTTQSGGRVLVGTSSTRSLASPTVVTRVQGDGSTATRQTLPIAYAKAAAYERAGIVVAGSRPGLTTAAAERAPVLVARGSIRGRHGVDRTDTLAGTRGQWVSSVAGNPASTRIALVSASMYNSGAPTRTLWVLRAKLFRRALTVRPGTNARDTAVAVGPRGDVLFVWQARGGVYARHLGPTGRAGATHRLGDGVQSALQARIDDDGRLEVAWESQRVGEGSYAHTPAVIRYTSAAPHHGFARPRILGAFSPLGGGQALMRPGVRLVAAGPNDSALAWTADDGIHVTDVRSGVVDDPQQTVSPRGADVSLGDLAATAAGARLVVWLTATRGTNSTGPQRVAAAVRAPGASVFGPPELVSAPIVPVAPNAAIDTRGRALAAWTTLDQQTLLAQR